MSKKNKCLNRTAKAALRASNPDKYSLHDERNRELAEIRALSAELRRMRRTLWSDKRHPESKSYDAIKNNWLRCEPTISAAEADEKMRTGVARVSKGEFVIY